MICFLAVGLHEFLMLQKLTPYWIHKPYFLPFRRWIFHFVKCLLCFEEAFVWGIPSAYLYFCCLCLWCQIKEKKKSFPSLFDPVSQDSVPKLMRSSLSNLLFHSPWSSICKSSSFHSCLASASTCWLGSTASSTYDHIAPIFRPALHWFCYAVTYP